MLITHHRVSNRSIINRMIRCCHSTTANERPDRTPKLLLGEVVKEPSKFQGMFDVTRREKEESCDYKWTCSFVLDHKHMFSAVPYGDSNEYEIDEKSGKVWFKRKKMAEHAAAVAALNGLTETKIPPSTSTNNTNTNVVSLSSINVIDSTSTRSTHTEQERKEKISDLSSGIYIVYKQQIDKLNRRLRNDRSLVIQALRLCMQDDDGGDGDYFRSTMSIAMGEKFSAIYSNSTQDDDRNELLIQRYKELFKQSVVGFCKTIRDDQKSLSFGSEFFTEFQTINGEELSIQHFQNLHRDKLAKLTIPIDEFESIMNEVDPSYSQFEYLLDWLANLGFSNSQEAKAHRESRKFQSLLEQTEIALTQKNITVNDRNEKLSEAKSSFADKEHQLASRYEDLLEKSLKERRSKAKANTNESFVSQVANKVLALFGIPSSNDDFESEVKIETDAKSRRTTVANVKRERKQIREELGKLRNQLQLSERAFETALKSVQHLEDQREKYKRIVSENQFRKMEKGIQTAYRLLTPLHAKYIADRHKTSLQHHALIQDHTDLTKPREWYLHTRLQQRKVIFHGGPTNSGKTFAALEALRRSENGIYLGPLRLLAGEIYEKLTTFGIYAGLHTGQEKRVVPFSTHCSATMEIAPTDKDFDVGVIDEIQMIGDASRGHAWTRAFLGLRAKEIHVCGGMEALPLIKKLTNDCGDKFEVRRYERFSELNVLDYSLADDQDEKDSFKRIRAGDCVVCFSRKDIFAIKREIESLTNLRCCVVYGALPPETRSSQARLFNDPNSGFDVLVASDAIGMGLNLNIKRIIFNSVFKSNGEKIVLLNRSEVKQIAGRAGRRNTPYPNGEITCRDPRDLEYIRECLINDVTPVVKAGLMPTAGHIQVYTEALSQYSKCTNTPHLHNILHQFNDLATVEGDYFLCRQHQMQVIAKLLKTIPLDLASKYSISMCPVNTTDKRSMNLIAKFALKIASGGAPGLRARMSTTAPKSFKELSYLCDTHHELELFMWLSNRFPGNEVEQQRAFALKNHAIDLISSGLSYTEHLKLDHDYILRDNRLRRAWKLANETSPEAQDYLAFNNEDEIEYEDEDVA